MNDPIHVFLPFTDSFLMVEVGELQSAMNVVILVASSPDCCSTWVSTIHKAKVKSQIPTISTMVVICSSFEPHYQWTLRGDKCLNVSVTV